MINGSPIGFFNSSGGPRQGDPLSPYLVVLGVEALSLLIDKAVSGGFLAGYKIKERNGEELQVTHLLFVDDTLVFYSDLEIQMAYLGWMLVWFKALSRLKINLEKKLFTSFGGEAQLRNSLGRGGRKVPQKASSLEEAVHLK